MYINNSQDQNVLNLTYLTGPEELLDKPLLQSFILSNDNTVKIISGKILAIPAAVFRT